MSIPVSNRLNNVTEYYFSVKLREIRQLQEQGRNIVNLGIGNPDLGPDESVLEEVKSSLSLNGSNGYQPYRGITELREGFSHLYKITYGVRLEPDHEVLPLMGSKEGIMHISMAFTNPGDRILIPDPGYPAYNSVAELLGLEVKKYDLLEENNWQPDIAQIRELCSDSCRIIWLNYPHMPTGAKVESNVFKQLQSFAEEKNLLLVNDNPYSQTNNNNPSSILQTTGINEHVMELNSLSKSHNMPGWRVGCLTGHRENITRVLQVKSNFDSGMFKPVQLAAAKAMLLPQEWHQNQNDIYGKRQEKIFEFCDFFKCSYSKDIAGLFVWAKKPVEFKNGKSFADHLLYDHNIFVAPGYIFGKNGNDHVRISLCQPIDILDNMMLCLKENIT